MLIPYQTDTPVYHLPFVTGGLILVNVIVFFTVPAHDAVILQYGNGLHPLQWVTANFLHADFLHLLGNMIFLWIFGLVVEGKIGGLRFLAVFLGIGILSCFIEQVITLGYSGLSEGSLGASGIIFGLLAISFLWAPKNEVQFYYVFFPIIGTTSWTIQTLAVVYFVFEFAGAFFVFQRGELISTPFLHLIGGAIGFCTGLVMLKHNLVDCEGWDFLSLQKRGGTTKPEKEHKSSTMRAAIEEDRQNTLMLIHDYLQSGDGVLAATVYENAAKASTAWNLPKPYLEQLINCLKKAGEIQRAKPYIRQYIDRFPQESLELKLFLASVYVNEESRPASALNLIESLPSSELSAAQSALKQDIIDKAETLLSEGVLEFDDLDDNDT